MAQILKMLRSQVFINFTRHCEMEIYQSYRRLVHKCCFTRWYGMHYNENVQFTSVVLRGGMGCIITKTRTLGALLLAGPRLLAGPEHDLRALRPCDQRVSDWIVCQPLDSVLAFGQCVSSWIVCQPGFQVTQQQQEQEESRILGVRMINDH